MRETREVHLSSGQGGEDQSLLPHVLDIKTGTKFLVDTGAEVSIVRPTRIDQSFKSYDRSLFAANYSPIATYGNKLLTLQLSSQQKFSWIFIVVDVKYNIIGSDFLTHFGMTVNLNKKCHQKHSVNFLDGFQT